jgi:hypothetical protein
VRPAMSPGGPRGARPPRRRSSNRTDRTGTETAGRRAPTGRRAPPPGWHGRQARGGPPGWRWSRGPHQCVDRRRPPGRELGERRPAGAGPGAHQPRTRRQRRGPGESPEPPTDAVAHHRSSDPATDGERDPRWAVTLRQPGHGQRSLSHSWRTAELPERALAPDAPDQADSLARPLARRALRIARPARVDIRCRNPWRFARRRLFGWNGRFTHVLRCPQRLPWRSQNRDPGAPKATDGQSSYAKSGRSATSRHLLRRHEKAVLRCANCSATSTQPPCLNHFPGALGTV